MARPNSVKKHFWYFGLNLKHKTKSTNKVGVTKEINREMSYNNYSPKYLIFFHTVASRMRNSVNPTSLSWIYTSAIAHAETKVKISCAVTTQLISSFVFAIYLVQSLYFLNSKFQVSSNLFWLFSLVCVQFGRKPRRQVSS